jgi:hypothetical protein
VNYKMTWRILLLTLIVVVTVASSLLGGQGNAVGANDYVQELDPTKTSSELTDLLQRAIDSSVERNKQLSIKNKNATYYISKTLHIPSNANIDFNNCTLKRDVKHGVFDMMLNKNISEGNSNITIRNLKLDGSKDADHRASAKKADRFIGLGLFNVRGASLINIEVSYTVNAEMQSEGTKSGIYFENCKDIQAKQIHGHNNDKTAILINNSKVIINGSSTYNNSGSGISSYNADYSEYYDITTHDNGYSQLSVNGQYSKVARVNAYNGPNGYASVNIGHNSKGDDSSNTVVSDIKISSGLGWGLTVNGSNDVRISDVIVSGNAKFNIYIMDNVNRTILDKITCFGSKSTGIYYKSGAGHSLNHSNVYGNAVYGIEIKKQADVAIGSLVRIHDNGKSADDNAADLVISGNASLNGRLSDESASTRSKTVNIWVAGGNLYLDPALLNVLGKTVRIRKTSGGQVRTSHD